MATAHGSLAEKPPLTLMDTPTMYTLQDSMAIGSGSKWRQAAQ